MFTNFKTMMRGSSVAANGARLVLGLCLFGLASASAAVQTFNINGTLAGGATFGGTLSINTTGNIMTALTAASVTISSPAVTCSSVNYQGAGGSAGYYFQLACTLGTFMLTLNTPLSPGAGGGYLNGYAGGTVNFSGPSFSYYRAGDAGNVQVASGTVAPALVAPTFSKAFGGATVPQGGTTSLTFTIVNPNASALTGLAFSDTVPAGLEVLPASLASNCGITEATLTTVSLLGGSLAASGTCTISVNVIGGGAGTDNNVTSTLTSNAPAAPAATASIYVTLPPTFSKAFAVPTLFAGTTTTLTFTIANSNSIGLTGLTFSDPLPVGLVVANVNGLTSTCGGTATAVAGSGSISLTGGTIAAGGTCTITVTVAGISPGSQLNTTSTLIANEASAPAATASILIYPTFDGSFQVSYAADPSAGESYINIINTGANGASLLGPGFGAAAGNICVNVYAFAPDEQEISCCSCLLTPNSVANLGVNRDLTSATLTGVIPSSVVVKLVSTLAGSGGSGTSCSAAAAAEGALANGMVAYGTTPQPVGTTFSAVEHTFVPSTLSAAEYASITGRCAAILGNGSGFGVCSSCRSGALGSDKQ